ncbi:hypothetical protein B0H15DRAFT_954694 [Mycena belliarum]|uniref:Uncharacterized protein n=1 Tax=Mycena belliarum TaxID=1033014 RepID=A0AAD6TUU1_9AGAR|nr:hypothetical protein B0H15DRAFT_954694 [Mycena belliae]
MSIAAHRRQALPPAPPRTTENGIESARGCGCACGGGGWGRGAPVLVRLGRWRVRNFAAQLLFDFVLVATLGWRPLVYLIASSFFAGSLHPCAEHFLWDGLAQETYRYYGPPKALAYNAYDTLPSHPSWPMVIVNFIRDKEVGIFARTKRL